MTRRGRGGRGLSPAVEAVLMVPLIVLLLGVMTAGFRLWQGRADLNQVAGAAARAASQARSASEAQQRINAVLDANQLPCKDPVVGADVGVFNAPVGTSGDVSVTITCRVGYADLLVPGLPGSQQLSGSGAAPLDPYRTRRP